jgi:hypothetical protein
MRALWGRLPFKHGACSMETVEWITSGRALALLRVMMRESAAARALCARANDGLIRARAERLVEGDKTSDNVEIPADFWSARSHKALQHNWMMGDFEMWTKHRLHVRAYGVSFRTYAPDKPTPTIGSGAKFA